MSLRVRAVCVAICLLFAAPVMPIRAVTSEDLAEALRFRTEFGLSTDPGYLQAIAASPNASRLYATPLSSDEQAEMDRRRDIESGLEPLILYLQQVPEFGGAYIDQTAGHLIVVGFAENANAHAESVRGLLPPDARVEVRDVRYSERDLRALQATIANDDPWFAELGTVALEVPFNPRTNRVDIGLSVLNLDIQRAVEGRYGSDRVTLYKTSNQLTHCVDRNHCHSPLRAGLQLYDVACSTNVTVTDGAYYLLTAGHCFVAGHVYQHPNGTNLGQMVRESFHANTSFDGGIIPIPSAQRHSRIWNTNAAWFQIHYAQTTSQEMVGQSACLSGRQRANGLNCGTVAAIGFPFKACHNLDCSVFTQMQNQRSGTYPNAVGDSGGAVFRAQTGTQYTVMGVQSSQNEQGRGIYSHISYLPSHLNAFVCRWSACP